ncbi:Lrp/AsnC family transcriptional regulator [Kriegella aquimaris]|uniref:Lrp/AsnC family transcriptional regulator, leucine-responsive regulatory protein n=1 Tax=Kriegella aquimaris TaxID=192904 RepID=A0A1G9K014_9FLAO|nr:Lrp/AsnC family transcriptional regulator [Kriegella aquimaris]SDL42493.1 Lrp/AsnC family transcriptional regulator, leucine-responsive regulatory protein [Kriegella aquimaris]
MKNLDATDIEILKILQNDSNITTKELAKEVHLSSTPVFERTKRLEKTGYIKKYIAVLSEEKLNRALTVFCHVKLKEHTKTIGHKFVQDIQSLNAVTECYNISGDYDFLLKVLVRDMKHYQDFVLNQLGSVQNIGSVQSTFAMGKIKHTHAVPF